jgi:hypothetical protein
MPASPQPARPSALTTAPGHNGNRFGPILADVSKRNSLVSSLLLLKR